MIIRTALKTIENNRSHVAYVIKVSRDMWNTRIIHSCISWVCSIIHCRVWEKSYSSRYLVNVHDRTSSVSTILNALEWDSLKLRRARARTIIFYRIYNRLVDIPLEEYLIPTGCHTRGHSSMFSNHITGSRHISTPSFPAPFVTGTPYQRLWCRSALFRHLSRA